MSLRSTLIGLFTILALCGGGLYAAHALFSRDSQMRNAERSFYDEHRGEIRSARQAAKDEDAEWEQAEAAFFDDADDDAPPSLDDWYAEAGNSGEAIDPAPEDKSHLINDAEPYSTGEPIDFDEAEL